MKRKIFHITIFIVLALVCAPLFAQAQKATDDNPRLVEIPGYDIMTSDLLKKIENLPTMNQSRFKSVEGQKQILDMMVTEQVFLKNAQGLGIDKREDVQQAIHIALRPVANEIYYAELLDKEPALTAADLKKYYNDNINNYTIAPRITIQHLEIDRAELGVMTEMARSEHADFLAMIKEHSQNPQTAATSGLIRNIRLNGNIVGIGSDPKLEGYIEKAEVSDEKIHGPYDTETGVHFFKKIEHEPAVVRPFDEMAMEIENRLTSIKDQEFYKNYMDKQYAKYNVVTHHDLIPENIYEVPSSEMGVVIVEGKHPDIALTLGEYFNALRSASQEREDISLPQVRSRILKKETDSRVMYAAAQDAKLLTRKKDDYQIQQTSLSTILSFWYSEEVSDKITVSQEEIQKYYNDNLGRLMIQAHREIRQFVAKNEKDAKKHQKAIAGFLKKKQTNKIIDLIRAESLRPEGDGILPNIYQNGVVPGLGRDEVYNSKV